MRIGFILSLIFAIFVSIFALQNSSTVSINFLFANIEMSQALVIFISAVAGAVIILILGLYREISLKLKVKKQTKIISSLEEQNAELKIELNKFNNATNTESNENSQMITQDDTVNFENSLAEETNSTANSVEKSSGEDSLYTENDVNKIDNPQN